MAKARQNSPKKATAKNTKGTIHGSRSLFNRIPRSLAIGVLLMVIGVIGVKLVSDSNATAFSRVGIHPQASKQSENSTGRQLKSLAAWNGKIYAGYGDWDKNTGPVYFTPFDPTTNSFAATSEHTADTESVEIWKNIGSKLYALHVDPKSHNGATYSVGDTSSGKPVWSNVSKVTMTHAFGLTTGSSESEMFLSGQLDEGSSTNEVAKIFRSTDGGASWTQSLSVPSRGGYNRMVFIAKLGNQIFAQGYSTTDFTGVNPESKAWIFNGSSWSKATPIANTIHPHNGGEFAGKMVALTGPRGGSLVAHDGRTTSTIRPSVGDYKVHSDGYLYALTNHSGNVAVMRTKDLTSWELISLAPNTSRSIAILGSTLYIGTSESELFKADINPSITDSTPPTASFIAPTSAYVVTTANEFAVNATDSSSIDRVEFYLGENRLGTATAKSTNVSGCFGGSCFNETATYPGSYSIRWNGSGVAAGTYELKAIAYDIYENSKETSKVSVTVPEGLYPLDTQKPTITVTSPTSDQRIRKNVWIAASANDNDILALFEIRLDGEVVAANSSYSISKSFPVSRGTHTLLITAKDRSGNTTIHEQTFNVR